MGLSITPPENYYNSPKKQQITSAGSTNTSINTTINTKIQRDSLIMDI